MAYFQMASAIGHGGVGLGQDTSLFCVLLLALGLCALGAAVRLLWRGDDAYVHTPPPRKLKKGVGPLSAPHGTDRA